MCLKSTPPFGCSSEQKPNAAHVLWAAFSQPHCTKLSVSVVIFLFSFQMKLSPMHPDVCNNSQTRSLAGTVGDFQEGTSLRHLGPPPVTLTGCQLSQDSHLSHACKGFSFPWCLFLLQLCKENSHNSLRNL